AATSGSFAGRTCWRETINVTSLPNDENMWTNSTPVTPEPMTTRCDGISGGGYASRVVRTRRPSTSAHSGTRGRLPVDTRMASASTSSTPSALSTTTSCALFKRALPWIMRTCWLSSRSTMPCCNLSVISAMRPFTSSGSMCDEDSVRPIPPMRRLKDMAPPVAIIAFDGMQSHRWAAPPIRSRSTIVTSAPRRAACVAAVLPAGPPPMITKRRGTGFRLRGGPDEAHHPVIGREQPPREAESDHRRRRGHRAEDEVHDRGLDLHRVDGVDPRQDQPRHRAGEGDEPDDLRLLDLRQHRGADGLPHVRP